MHLSSTPGILRVLLPHAEWKVKTREKALYLTFDDGPTPGITGITLDILREHGAKAGFFCLGKNIEAHPELFQRIKDEQHSVGNHGYEHLNGWKCGHAQYLCNARKGATLSGSKLFRPPYGQMTWKQYRQLSGEYRLIMWDVMAGDFDEGLSAQNCFERVRRKARPGSLIVLHDSAKAGVKMHPTLRAILRHFGAEGYAFRAIS